MKNYNSEVLEPFPTNDIILELLHNNSFAVLSSGELCKFDSDEYSVCKNIKPYASSIEEGFDLIQFYMKKFPIIKQNCLYGFEFSIDDKAHIKAITTDRQLEKELVREKINVPDFSNHENNSDYLSL